MDSAAYMISVVPMSSFGKLFYVYFGMYNAVYIKIA